MSGNTGNGNDPHSNADTDKGASDDMRGRRGPCGLRGVCSKVMTRLWPRTFATKLTIVILLLLAVLAAGAVALQQVISTKLFEASLTIENDGATVAQGWWNSPEDSGSMMFSTNDMADGSSTLRDIGGMYTLTTPDGITVWTTSAAVGAMRVGMVASFLLFGLLGAVCVWLVCRRMSRRLVSVSAQADALDAESLADAHIDVGSASRHPDEVDRLAVSLNDLLARIDAAYAAQRRFVSNASHELRTPIAMIETNLDAPLAQGRFPEDVTPSVERALAANHRAAALVDALLQLSRIESGAYGSATAGKGALHQTVGARTMDDPDRSDVRPFATPERTDVRECVDAALADDALREEITRRGLSVDVMGLRSCFVCGGRTLLDLAVGNLARNAVLHNVAGGRVVISIVPIPAAGLVNENTDEDDATATRRNSRKTENKIDGGALIVTNTTDERFDGDMDDLTQPFHRGAQSRLAGTSGVGLGLSIAKAACEALGANLRLSQTPEGMFEACIIFAS